MTQPLILWRTDMAVAQAEAQATRRMLLIDFSKQH